MKLKRHSPNCQKSLQASCEVFCLARIPAAASRQGGRAQYSSGPVWRKREAETEVVRFRMNRERIEIMDL